MEKSIPQCRRISEPHMGQLWLWSDSRKKCIISENYLEMPSRGFSYSKMLNLKNAFRDCRAVCKGLGVVWAKIHSGRKLPGNLHFWRCWSPHESHGGSIRRTVHSPREFLADSEPKHIHTYGRSLGNLHSEVLDVADLESDMRVIRRKIRARRFGTGIEKRVPRVCSHPQRNGRKVSLLERFLRSQNFHIK